MTYLREIDENTHISSKVIEQLQIFVKERDISVHKLKKIMYLNQQDLATNLNQIAFQTGKSNRSYYFDKAQDYHKGSVIICMTNFQKIIGVYINKPIRESEQTLSNGFLFYCKDQQVKVLKMKKSQKAGKYYEPRFFTNSINFFHCSPGFKIKN